MATIDEMREIVRRGVQEFAKAEQGIEDATISVNNLVPIFHDAVKAGMVDGRKGIQIMNRLRKIVGKLAEASEEIHDLHSEGTKIAKKNDADIELPGDFVVLGGGGR